MSALFGVLKLSFPRNFSRTYSTLNRLATCTSRMTYVSEKIQSQKDIVMPNFKISNRLACCKCEPHNAEWVYERLAALALVFLMPACVVMPNPYLDLSLIPLFTYHHYVGLRSVINDYCRPENIGHFTNTIINLFNIITTAVMAVGLIYFVKNDIGIGNAARMVWNLNYEEKGGN